MEQAAPIPCYRDPLTSSSPVTQLPEVFSHGGGGVFALEGEVEVGFEEFDLVADVVALAAVFDSVGGFLLEKGAHGVGELDFSVLARLGGGEFVEDARGENVAGRDSEAAGGLLWRGFFDPCFNFEPGVGFHGAASDAVAADFLQRDFFQSDGGGSSGFESIEQLAEDGLAGWVVGFQNAVTKEDGERFISDEGFRMENGIAEAAHLLLPGEMDAGEVVEPGDGFQFGEFPFGTEFGFEFWDGVEVFFERALPPTDDEKDVGDAAGDGFFDDVLDNGFVHHG